MLPTSSKTFVFAPRHGSMALDGERSFWTGRSTRPVFVFFQAGNGLHVQHKAAARQQPGSIVEIGAEQFWIKHGLCVC
jgi:hypothetical protein